MSHYQHFVLELPPGATGRVHDVAGGWSVGSWEDAASGVVPCRWDPAGHVAPLPHPCTKVNASGVGFGVYTTAGAPAGVARIDVDGTRTDHAGPPGTHVVLEGVNASGMIAATAVHPSSGDGEVVRWLADGTLERMNGGNLGGDVHAAGIDDAGTVLVTTWAHAYRRSALWPLGAAAATELAIPGAAGAYAGLRARAIAGDGTIVCMAQVGGGGGFADIAVLRLGTWSIFAYPAGGDAERRVRDVSAGGAVVLEDAWVHDAGGWEHLERAPWDAPDAYVEEAVAIDDDARIAVNLHAPAGPLPRLLVPVTTPPLPLPLPTFDRAAPAPMFTQIFGGVLVDGGGLVIVNGKPHPVPPWDPRFRALSPVQLEAVTALAAAEMASCLQDEKARALALRGAAQALAGVARAVERGEMLKPAAPATTAAARSRVRAADAVLPDASRVPRKV